MNRNVQKCLSNRGYTDIDTSFEAYTSEWLDWYKGKVDSFHKYEVFNGATRNAVERYSLGMAKRVCEDWANLLMNERTSISTGSDSVDKALKSVLESNNFYVEANRLVELTYALGLGAFVCYRGSDEVMVDYVRGDNIYPLSFERGDITECAFISECKIAGKPVSYVQLHLLNNDKTYRIENIYIDLKSGNEIDAPDDVEPIVNTGLDTPLYSIIKPNMINNIDLSSPRGISCFANAIDQLKSLDIVYDSYTQEFVLGRKRLLVPASMARIQQGKNGSFPLFDSNDLVYCTIPSDNENDTIKEIDLSIRATEHETGLNQNLSLLSFSCGLGNDRYKFESGTIKTATEVISEKSELFQSVEKQKILVRSALVNLTHGILKLLGIDSVDRTDIDIDFDDSIIIDSEAEQSKRFSEVTAGIISKTEYLKRVYNVSDEEARKLQPEEDREITEE